MSNIKVTNKSSSNLNLKYHQTIPRSCDKFLDILFLSGMQMKTRGFGLSMTLMPRTPTATWRVKCFFTTLEMLYSDCAGTSSDSEITAPHSTYSAFGQWWLLKFFL